MTAPARGPEALAPRSRILGTGSYLPDVTRHNVELEKLVDTNDAWIRERTGIRERRIAPDGIVTSDMAAEAARRALATAELTAADLDLIICATVTPDMPMPATAVFVQQKIGAKCAAFDLSAACAGFIYGMTIADQFVRGGAAKNVLVIGVELLSRVVNWADRTTCVLFGDGAGAAVIGPADGGGRGIIGTRIHSDGSLAESLMIPGGGSREPMDEARLRDRRNKVHMKGQDIFKAAVRNLYSASTELVDSCGLTNDQVDWVVPHQANIRIIDQVAARANYPKEKVLSNIERVGNTSSASIPILLDERVKDGTIKPGDLVLMCALGAGVSWGSALVRM
ncbi:MAG TPA: beta-ketoacyl-ACP synthase III [Polyangiaceae bacterium]|nr:beta-ketoacyl-ACP synthase III [Polyangiaceae bacterium]